MALATSGCCAPRGVTSLDLNRDTPRNAFEYVQAALDDDRIGDLYDSLHPTFADEQGITAAKMSLAHSTMPGAFRDFAEILRNTSITGIEQGERPIDDGGAPRRWARVRLSSDDGRAEGVFILVDRPVVVLLTDDEEVSPTQVTLPMGVLEKTVQVKDGHLFVGLRVPLGEMGPLDGSAVHRVEVRHEWLLYGVESLDGMDELLERVRGMDEEAQGNGNAGETTE
jgi:hypothetical protein